MHTLKGVRLTAVPGSLVVECTCGEVSSTVKHQKWDLQVSADGKTVRCSPSLDWAGHFHTANPVVADILDA